MRWNNHFRLEGRHAFLSPSQYSWIRYDDDKLESRFLTSREAQRGTDLHELAKNLIRLGVRLPKNTVTLNNYVNDCIGFRMTPEQSLYYSEYCFGTADAIHFNPKKMLLRIFDLKTGVTKTSVDQLLVYAAIFCLEYNFKPFELSYDLRIYQNDEVQTFDTDPGDIARIMDRIIWFDKKLTALHEEIG